MADHLKTRRRLNGLLLGALCICILGGIGYTLWKRQINALPKQVNAEPPQVNVEPPQFAAQPAQPPLELVLARDLELHRLWQERDADDFEIRRILGRHGYNHPGLVELRVTLDRTEEAIRLRVAELAKLPK